MRRIGGEGEADLNQRVGRDGFQSEVGGLEGETFVQHEPDIFLITLAAVVPEAGERFNRQLSPSDFQRAGQLGRLGRLVPGVRHWPAPANFLRLIMGQGWLDLFREASRLSARAALRDNCLSSRATKNYSLAENPLAIITGASRVIARVLAEKLPTMPGDEQMVLVLGGLMLGVGLAFKLSAVPFHFWCPDVFEGATAEIDAFLANAPTAKGNPFASLGA